MSSKFVSKFLPCSTFDEFVELIFHFLVSHKNLRAFVYTDFWTGARYAKKCLFVDVRFSFGVALTRPKFAFGSKVNKTM